MWTDTQYNMPAQIILNGADPDALYSANQPGNSTDALTVAVKVPNTSTVYRQQRDCRLHAESGHFNVSRGGLLSGRGRGRLALTWALNTLSADAGFSNTLIQNELDFNVTGTGTTVLGLGFFGASTVAPADQRHCDW